MNKQKYQRNNLTRGKNYFKMIWYIPEAIKIVKRDNVKANIRSISSIHIDKNEINNDHLKVAINNKKPASNSNYI
jgi:hypothetical protein